MRNEGSGRGWIGGLLLSVAASLLAQPKPSVDEIFKRVAQTYEELRQYQFEIHQGGGIVKLAAILPDSIYISSVGLDSPGLDGDVQCVNSPGRKWRVSAGPNGGRGPTLDPGLRGRDLCKEEFGAAEKAFVDRWKRISQWAGESAIRGEGSVSVGKSKSKCWIVDIQSSNIQSSTNADRTELWIDQFRYLVLREIFENKPQHIHVRRDWTEARIDVPPDASLFNSPGSRNYPRR
jgi:hypothetical protein